MKHSGKDAWKTMKVRPAGDTFKFNMKKNLYYDKADRAFTPHDYLGLYQDKRVKALGKICAVVRAKGTESGIDYLDSDLSFGALTEERKKKIALAMENIDQIEKYPSREVERWFFFVEQFYETDFRKVTPGPLRGAKKFDLTVQLERNDIPPVDELAKELDGQYWK